VGYKQRKPQGLAGACRVVVYKDIEDEYFLVRICEHSERAGVILYLYL